MIVNVLTVGQSGSVNKLALLDNLTLGVGMNLVRAPKRQCHGFDAAMRRKASST
jgi:hypothetical protein